MTDIRYALGMIFFLCYTFQYPFFQIKRLVNVEEMDSQTHTPHYMCDCTAGRILQFFKSNPFSLVLDGEM